MQWKNLIYFFDEDRLTWLTIFAALVSFIVIFLFCDQAFEVHFNLYHKFFNDSIPPGFYNL